MIKTDEDVHVVIVDDRNKSKTFRFLRDIFSVRNFSDKEFFLIDVGDFNRTSVGAELSNFKIDLDDDFFFFSYKNLTMSGSNKTGISDGLSPEIRIWEFYRINGSFPVTVLDFANWTSSSGLVMTHLEKWKRRRDLMVVFFFFQM